jgi:hypothetical protein
MTLPVEQLVFVIMIPVYTLGFIVVGYLGYRKRKSQELLATPHQDMSGWYRSQMFQQEDERISASVTYSYVNKPTEQIYVDATTSNAGRSHEPYGIDRSATPMLKPRLRDDSTVSNVYFRTNTHLELAKKDDKLTHVKTSLYKFYDIAMILSIPILTFLDYTSDISMAVYFLSNGVTQLGVLCVFTIVMQRVTSAIILADHYGWETGVRQLFDLEMFFAVYESVIHERTVLQIIQAKILEGFFESFPQLFFQTYYVVKPSYHAEWTSMIYISITLSILSLSKCWLFSYVFLIF